MTSSDNTPSNLLQLIPAATMLHSMPTPVLLVNAEMAVTDANDLAARLVGRDPHGVGFTDLVIGEDREAAGAYLLSLLDEETEGATRFIACSIGTSDDRCVELAISGSCMRTGSESVAVLCLTDVTAQNQRERQLARLAHTDALTGLANRPAFQASLRKAISTGNGCVVALADVDRFKLVNDQFGHATGDVILVAVAQSIRDGMPPGATVARLGGDEFAVLLPGSIDEEGLRQLEALREIALPLGVRLEGLERVSLSIGVTHTTAGSETDILRQCDTAMYGAKRAGRAQVAVYGEKSWQIVDESGSIVALVHALRRENERLHRDARTDARTGLANNRALAEVESRVVGVDEGRWSGCGVLFIDVDRFGDFNKLYGDHAGDEALKSVACALQRAGRKTDLAFRKGGEEFVMVLPLADSIAIAAVCERVAACIAELRIPHARGPTGWLSALIVGTVVAPAESVGEAVVRAGNQAMRCKLDGIRARVVMA